MTFTPNIHTHDDRYYTESEFKTIINGLFLVKEYDHGPFYMYKTDEPYGHKFEIEVNGYTPIVIAGWAAYNNVEEGGSGYDCSYANLYGCYISEDEKTCSIQIRANGICTYK